MIETLFSEINVFNSVVGGFLIGLSATLLLLFNGRIADITGTGLICVCALAYL